MIEAKDKLIDGDNYRFTPLMVKQARAELDKLIQKFGPAIALAVKGFESINLDADIDLEGPKSEALLSALPAVAGSVSGAVTGFSAALSPAYHADLVETFFKNVELEVDGGWRRLEPKFCNVHFATKLLTETKVLLFCLEVQYSDFFGLWESLGATIRAVRESREKSRSDSQTESTGISTE
jgi:hypothetical protein